MEKTAAFIRSTCGSGREANEPEKFKQGKGTRRAEKSQDSEMYNRYLWYCGSLEASMCFGMLIGTTDSHLPLLPMIKEMTFWQKGITSPVPAECWLLSNFWNLGKWQFFWT